jgi:hypothetical protein
LPAAPAAAEATVWTAPATRARTPSRPPDPLPAPRVSRCRGGQRARRADAGEGPADDHQRAARRPHAGLRDAARSTRAPQAARPSGSS